MERAPRRLERPDPEAGQTLRRQPTRPVGAGTALGLFVAVAFVLALLPPVSPTLVSARWQGGNALTVSDAEAAYQLAEQAYHDAGAEVVRATEHVHRLELQAAQFEVELRGLDAASLERVLTFEATLRHARDLAVSAYVLGGRQGELALMLGSAQAEEAAVRGQLLAGGVDRASDAAAVLRSERARLDAASAKVAVRVAGLRRALADADAVVGASLSLQQRAYDELVARGEQVASARADAAAQVAATLDGPDGEGDAGTAPPESSSTSTSPTTASPPATRPAAPPPPPPPASGDKAAAWAKVRECESGGNYRAIGGGGLYRGAYQFSQPTWEAVGGTGDPAAASPEEQDYRARLLYERSGSGQWPFCGRYLDEA